MLVSGKRQDRKHDSWVSRHRPAHAREKACAPWLNRRDNLQKQTGRNSLAQLPVRDGRGFDNVADIQFLEISGPPVTEIDPELGEIIRILPPRWRLTVKVDNEEFSAEAGWGAATLEKVSESLARRGLSLNSCFTCRYYQPSGMTSEWSYGTEGYCVLTNEPDMEFLTHILHICKSWNQKPNATAE